MAVFMLRFLGTAMFLALGCLASVTGKAADVVEIAHAIKDGGGYEWKGTGVPEDIRFNGERILAKGQSTYCSGFTFAVVMRAASERGLCETNRSTR